MHIAFQCGSVVNPGGRSDVYFMEVLGGSSDTQLAGDVVLKHRNIKKNHLLALMKQHESIMLVESQW